MNVQTRIENIKSSLENISNNKVFLAFELLATKRETNWKETQYVRWSTFCDMEVALSQASVYVYLKTAQLAENNKFGRKTSSHIVNTIGWDRFRIGLTKIDQAELITAAQFIERYKNLNLNERVTYEKDEGSLVNFNFNIPADVADMLTNELVARGMRITNKSRSNSSAALVKLIKELQE
jgi:hypothetical protein